MLVKNWMSKDVITVDVGDSMPEATRILKEHEIRILPVMDKGRLVGVVSDRDLKKASASSATTLEIYELLYLLAKIKIKDIMTRHPITVPPDYTVEETAELLLENRISGAPVVNDRGEVVGIITQDDLFRVLIELSGLKERGIQFGFYLKDQPGSIKEVTDILRMHGCRVISILSHKDDGSSYRYVYIRACDCNRETLEQLKEELKATADTLYFADHLKHQKEVYRVYARPSAGRLPK